MYKSPFSPPLIPGLPLPDTRCLSPVFTPAGILIVSFFDFLTFPLPLQALHLRLYVLPLPLQSGHGPLDKKEPRIVCL